MGIKKDLRSIKKDTAAIKDKWDVKHYDENVLIIAAIDSSLTAAKGNLKTRALLPKTVIYSSKAVVKKAKEVRNIQAKKTLRETAAGCELGILPEKERRSPKLQAHSKVPTGLAEKYKMNSQMVNAMAIRSHGRQYRRSGEAGRTDIDVIKRDQPIEKNVPPVNEVDTSDIERKNGIKQRGNSRSKGTVSNADRIEEKNGIHARGQKGSNRCESSKKHVLERKELHGNEKIKDIEKKNGIKSKNNKDNQKKKKSRKGEKGKRKGNSAAKQEMKRYVMNQIVGGGSDETCASGFGEMGANILKSKVKNSVQDMIASLTKAAGKIVWNLLLLALKLALSLLKWILIFLLSVLVAILSALMPILLIGVLVVAFVSAIGGLFGIGSKGDEFVVDRIKDHVAVVAEEVTKADEVRYHAYDGSYDIYMNQDDMLLIYLSKMADLDDVENEEAFDGSEAPYFIVNKHKEKKTLEEVMTSMLYFTKGSYEKEITVTVTPAPTPVPSPTLCPSPTSAPATPVGTPAPRVTPVPSGVPSVTPVPETTTIKVTVYTLDIYMRTAEDYLTEHGLKESQREVYDVLLEMFTDMGYSPGGGSTICDSY